MKKLLSVIFFAVLALAISSCAEEPIYFNLSYEAVSEPSMNMAITLNRPQMDRPMQTGGSHLFQDCGPVKNGYSAEISAKVINPNPAILEDATITLRILIDDKIVKETTAKSEASLSYVVDFGIE